MSGADRRRRQLLAALAPVLAAPAAAARASAEPQIGERPRTHGFSGRIEVKQIEVGFQPGANVLRVRVHLVSGLAVEFDTRHADDVERVLDMALILAAGRARMFVELEGNEIQAFQVSVP